MRCLNDDALRVRGVDLEAGPATQTTSRSAADAAYGAERKEVEAEEHAETEDDAEEADVLEPWLELLRRTARWTEDQIRKAGQKEWITSWRERQWAWACKLMTADAAKWSAVATHWEPLLHSSRPRGRAPSRPRKRWDQDIIDYLEERFPNSGRTWKDRAKEKTEWMKLASDFAGTMCSNI